MYNFGKAGIEEIMEVMYNHYDIQCIAEALEPVNKEVFRDTVSKVYYFYEDNKEGLKSEDKMLVVILNEKNNKPYIYVSISCNKDNNVEMSLIIEPEVKNGRTTS